MLDDRSRIEIIAYRMIRICELQERPIADTSSIIAKFRRDHRTVPCVPILSFMRSLDRPTIVPEPCRVTLEAYGLHGPVRSGSISRDPGKDFNDRIRFLIGGPMDHFVRLDKMPDGYQFPPDLQDRILFDPEAHKLVFRGYMSKGEFDRLSQLTRDWGFRRSLEELFRLMYPRGRLRGGLGPRGLRVRSPGSSRRDERSDRGRIGNSVVS